SALGGRGGFGFRGKFLCSESRCILSQRSVVVGVRSDPEPVNSLRHVVAERAVVIAHAHRPQFSDALEVERGMARVGLQQLVVLVRNLADALREGGVLRPKGRRSKMLQISFDLPDLSAARALFTSRSSFPAFESALI